MVEEKDALTRVLIVEDDEDDADLVKRTLGKSSRHFEFHWAESLAALRDCDQPDILLLDLNLPDSRGIVTLYAVEPLFPGIPIIVLTGLSDRELGVTAMKAGAQDYICKNELTTSSLPRAIDYAIERKRHMAMLERMAKYDALTNLPNRSLFYDLATRSVARARRQKQQGGLALLDLDGFKAVNDQYGHAAGDQVLEAVADRMRENCRGSDQLGRLGGDEFTLLLENVQNEAGAQMAVGRFAQAIATPITLATKSGSASVCVTASIGIALFPKHGEDVETLMVLADRAMYKAKNAGKSQSAVAG